VGKTTLLRDVIAGIPLKTLSLNGETSQVQDAFAENSVDLLQRTVAGFELVVIDEAQKIPDIGSRLKLLVDSFPDLRVIASGSSSFDLARQIGEPLTGRKISFLLYPLAQMELSAIETPIETRSRLPERLIFGAYPEVILSPNTIDKTRYLVELCDSYLYKDILELDGLRSARKVRDILRLLGFQIGHEVSLNELAQNVELSRITVSKYLDMLEKSFVIIRVGGFSRNLRNEIRKSDRYYFFDNGVRNALINNFNELPSRNDLGMLWENYIVIERMKWLAYTKTYTNTYFWRTHDRQEIDWVEERGGKLYGYEFTWKDSRRRVPSHWQESYAEAEFSVITSENYLDFISGG